LPSPIYLDYSLQYIYVFAFALIFSSLYNLKQIYIGIFLLFLVTFKSFNYYKIFFAHGNSIQDKKYYSYSSLEKRNFWQKNSDHFLKNKYAKKELLIDFPNKETEYSKYVLKNNKFDDFFSHKVFNKKFKHSMNEFEYHSNFIITNLGHSLLLDISSFKANFLDKKILHPKERIPRLSLNSELVNFYNLQYIFSDKEYDLKLDKKYNFDEFNLYVYQNKILKINEFFQIKKINNFDNYSNDIKNFNKYIYLVDNKFKTDKLKICKILRQTNNKELIFKVSTNEKCIAIFPIPFSYTNDFKIKNSKTHSSCDTFRVQYYFHGCVFYNEKEVTLKKKNLILYPFFSLKDFYFSKKLNII